MKEKKKKKIMEKPIVGRRCCAIRGVGGANDVTGSLLLGCWRFALRVRAMKMKKGVKPRKEI